MLVDMCFWCENVCEGSLCVFYYCDEFDLFVVIVIVIVCLVVFVQNCGFCIKVFVCEGGVMLIIVKVGVGNKIGYIFVYMVIVVICIGGLLDGDMMICVQMWFGGKLFIKGNVVISDIGLEYWFLILNFGFCGNVFVLEGLSVSMVILNIVDGVLIQDLLFMIMFKKFMVEYYLIGMLKLFVSDIVVIDCCIGKQIVVCVEVNKLFVYDGVVIYQLSFEDGGLKFKLIGFLM